MATQSGRTSGALIEQLLDKPYRFEFFQAVRLLERHARANGESPVRYAVGFDYPPKQEVARFRALPAHSFPAGSIAQLHRGDGEPAAPCQLVVTFMGLTGPGGVLPPHYTSLVIERSHVKNKDFALRDFLDLFNHRAISLFFRAWEKYRFPFAYERTRLVPQTGQQDLFTFCLYALVGLGTSGLRGRLAVDDEAVLFYAGHFAHFPRSAIGLELLLADYFGLPIAIRQFQGQWLALGMDDQSSLPSAAYPDGRNLQLGVNVIAGERVWDVQSKFRIRLGPLRYRDFLRFMPLGAALAELAHLTRLYAGPEFDFDVQPVLMAAEAPWCRLDSRDPAGARLGWNTWVRANEFQRDVEDAVFCLDAA
jgi:type VI secretion system protein ImpH